MDNLRVVVSLAVIYAAFKVGQAATTLEKLETGLVAEGDSVGAWVAEAGRHMATHGSDSHVDAQLGNRVSEIVHSLPEWLGG
ncbi:MAG: hypothetical protein CMJ58_06365 [Planctomycetaceae bacterium]|jgi:hypothetical protein|nr:hypothetical protein [Planctomycetaceae bacterium]